MEGLLQALKTHTTPLSAVPRGRKEGVWFIVDNEDNVSREKRGLPGRYWDDCGAYSSGGNLGKYYYHCVDGQEPQLIYNHQGTFHSRPQVSNKRAYAPLVPQPPENEVLVISRKYNTLKAGAEYIRRITTIKQLPSTYADDSRCLSVALYEYNGIFPRNMLHGNARSETSQYQRTEPQVMDSLHELVNLK